MFSTELDDWTQWSFGCPCYLFWDFILQNLMTRLCGVWMSLLSLDDWTLELMSVIFEISFCRTWWLNSVEFGFLVIYSEISFCRTWWLFLEIGCPWVLETLITSVSVRRELRRFCQLWRPQASAASSALRLWQLWSLPSRLSLNLRIWTRIKDFPFVVERL